MYSTISQFTGDSVTVQMQQSKTDEVFCIYVTCFQPLAQISALNAEFRNFSADFSPQKMRNKCGVLGRGDPHAETRMRKKCGGNAEEMTECGKKMRNAEYWDAEIFFRI